MTMENTLPHGMVSECNLWCGSGENVYVVGDVKQRRNSEIHNKAEVMKAHLFGPVLGFGRQIVVSVMGLSDPTEQHCYHT